MIESPNKRYGTLCNGVGWDGATVNTNGGTEEMTTDVMELAPRTGGGDAQRAQMTALLARVEERAEAERLYRERAQAESGGLGVAGLVEGIDRLGRIRAELAAFLTWAAPRPEVMLDEAREAAELLDRARESWTIRQLRVRGYRILFHDGEEIGAGDVE